MSMDEFSFIARLLSPLATHPGAYSLTDDAASLAVPAGQDLVITKDALVRGVHFVGNEPASLIARKALRTNLSDCAAMGATPVGYLLALMLPPETTETWLAGFADGLRTDQQEFGISLLGGDTTCTHVELAISITLLGQVPAGQALRRNGAIAGDDIYVSGTIGDAALGLSVAQDPNRHEPLSPHQHFLLSRYHLPQPRIALGQQIRMLASACMDISDGLMQDLDHICAASGVGATLEWERIPLSDAARECNPSPELILAGGDDYELLFTAPASASAVIAGITGITRIGSICGTDTIRVLGDTGSELLLAHKGYRHF